MHIKKRLRLNAGVSLLMAVVIGFVLMLSLYRLNKANDAAIVAGEIVTSALERVSLRNDYIGNKSERAKGQWFVKHEQVGRLLQTATEYFQGSEDRQVIGTMIKRHKTIAEIFSTLVAIRENVDINGSVALHQDAEDRLVNQLNLKGYEVVIHGRALLETSQKARASALRQAAGGVIFSLLVIVTAAIINIWSLSRAITDRVNRLRASAIVIGGGDLDHVIDLKGNDEFTDLSMAFNAMTTKLSCSYHNLEVEIDERKHAEEQLRHSEERFRIMGEILPYGTWWCNAKGDAEYTSQAFLNLIEMSMDEMREVGWTSRLPPEEVGPTMNRWMHCVRTGEDLESEHTILGPDGTYHAVLMRGRPVRDKTGNIVGWAGINLDIEDRKQAEEQIKAALAEKEVMLREIHHRVKNNLQVISSLVSIQAGNLADEQMRAELNAVTDRVRAMALVHEKLYQTGDLGQLDFADYAASMLRSLWNSHGALADKVRLNFATVPLVLSIEAAIPCGLILNELACNALKHAFPDSSGGEVTIGMEQDRASGTVCLRVSDSGVGLPANMDWRQTNSLGLRLVQILAGQLRGAVETGPGPGAEFRVTFPLKGV